jgi:hypothetical protein
MISVFQVDVAPGDEPNFDELIANKLAQAVNLEPNRVGVPQTVHVLKGDVQGSSNKYIFIVGISGLGLPFDRVFKDAGFPASMKVTALAPGAFHQVTKFPDKAPPIEP